MTDEADDDARPMLLEDQIAAITDDDAPAGGTGDGEGAGEGSGEGAKEGETTGAEGAASEGEEAGGEGEGEGPHSEEQEERKRPSWQAKRFNKLTADRDAAMKLADERQAKIDAMEAAQSGEEGASKLYTQAEVDAMVSSEAERRASAKLTDGKLDALFDAGVTAHKDFEARVTAYGQAFGPELAKRTDFFDALTELPNGSEVIYELGGDLDHMAEVLEMSPAKMGIELARMSVKLAEAAKPKPKPITKAPAPITPLETKARTELAMDDDDMPMEEFGKRLFRGMAERAG